MSTLKEILRHGLTEMGLARDDSVLDRLELFSQRLLETNQVQNLTALTEPDGGRTAALTGQCSGPAL